MQSLLRAARELEKNEPPIPKTGTEGMLRGTTLVGGNTAASDSGGADGIRTRDLNTASVALSQLSYSPRSFETGVQPTQVACYRRPIRRLLTLKVHNHGSRASSNSIPICHLAPTGGSLFGASIYYSRSSPAHQQPPAGERLLCVQQAYQWLRAASIMVMRIVEASAACVILMVRIDVLRMRLPVMLYRKLREGRRDGYEPATGDR